MNINEVVKYPILTEKSEIARSNKNLYTFAVDPRCNKIEIKQAIEFIFGVKVVSINVINYDKKPANLGRSKGFKPAVKKAYVQLAEGSKIILFPEEAKAEELEAKKKAREQKSTELTDVENKAAEKIAAKAKAKAEPKKSDSAEKKSEVKKPATKSSSTKTTKSVAKTTEVKKEAKKVEAKAKPKASTAKKEAAPKKKL